MSRSFVLSHTTARQRAIDAIRLAPNGYVVEVKQPTRSLQQNARLWAMLTDISRDVDWYGQHLTQDEWKDVLTAALKKQKVVPGIDGGFVVIGARTSKMTKAELSELMDLADAFGTERGVVWTEPATEFA